MTESISINNNIIEYDKKITKPTILNIVYKIYH